MGEHLAHQIIENYRLRLEDGSLDQAIARFRQLGLDPAAVEFSLDAANYYVPRQQGDHFIEPQGTDDDAIPVIAVEDSRVIHTPRPRMHSLQQTKILEQYGAWAKRDLQAQGHLAPRSQRALTRDTALANTHRPTLRTKQGLEVRSRPFIVFRNGGRDASSLVSAFIHELVHVAQTLDSPVLENTDELFEELQAHTTQATLVESERIPVTNDLALSYAVSSFVKMHMGNVVVRPDTYFRQQFANDERFVGFMRTA